MPVGGRVSPFIDSQPYTQRRMNYNGAHITWAKMEPCSYPKVSTATTMTECPFVTGRVRVANSHSAVSWLGAPVMYCKPEE